MYARISTVLPNTRRNCMFEARRMQAFVRFAGLRLPRQAVSAALLYHAIH